MVHDGLSAAELAAQEVLELPTRELLQELTVNIVESNLAAVFALNIAAAVNVDTDDATAAAAGGAQTITIDQALTD